MTRTLWTAVAVVALAASIPLMAQPPQGRGFGRGMGPGPGGPGGPGMGPGPMGIFQQLNLTEAQREQIRAMTEEWRKDPPEVRMMELEKQLHTLVFSDAPDLGKINELKAAIAAAQSEHLSRRVDHELQLVQVLTPEQLAKAREIIANGRPPGPGRGRRGGF